MYGIRLVPNRNVWQIHETDGTEPPTYTLNRLMWAPGLFIYNPRAINQVKNSGTHAGIVLHLSRLPHESITLAQRVAQTNQVRNGSEKK